MPQDSRLIHVREFLRLERANGRAPATLRNRLAALGDFGDWLCAHNGTSAAEVTSLDLAEYVCDLRERLAPGHLNVRISALRTYFRCLEEFGVRPDNPAAHLHFARVRPRPVESLTTEEIAKLARFASRAHRLRFGTYRTAVLILTLLDTGLRVGEALDLRVSALDVADACLLVNAPKTRDFRVVPVGPALGRHLMPYLRHRRAHLGERHIADADRIFPAEDGGPWTVRAAEQGCVTVARLAGVHRRFYPHLCRHTWAVHSLNNGASLFAVKQMGGWDDIRTVEQYSHNSRAQLREIAAASSPLAQAARQRFLNLDEEAA